MKVQVLLLFFSATVASFVILWINLRHNDGNFAFSKNNDTKVRRFDQVQAGLKMIPFIIVAWVPKWWQNMGQWLVWSHKWIVISNLLWLIILHPPIYKHQAWGQSLHVITNVILRKWPLNNMVFSWWSHQVNGSHATPAERCYIMHIYSVQG